MASADLGAGAALFTVEAMVRGYHVYKDVWSAALGEQLYILPERAYKHEGSLRCGGGAITCYRRSYTKEDIFNMLHVSSTG